MTGGIIMTESERNFLAILKGAINNKDITNELCRPIDWAGVLKAARKQNLFSFVYDAASEYTDDGFSEFEESHPDYFASVMNSVAIQMGKESDFLELYKEFQKDGLSPIAMKGIICRSLYGEKGNLRPSGDEDILIEKSDYDKAEAVLRRCGYSTVDKPDSEMSLIQEVTFEKPDSELPIELHINPFGSSDEIRCKMNTWFRDVFDGTETMTINGVELRTMKPTDNFLFMAFHSFKHFIGGGFGIRLMLDELLFMKKCYDSIDWDYVRKGLEDVGAYSFTSDLIRIGNEYLGFNLPEISESTCPDELLEDMLRMGTFGNTTTEDAAAGGFTSRAVQQSQAHGTGKKMGKFKATLRLLFPSWQTWKSRKPFLEDKPYLLPVEWIKRVIRYLKGETTVKNLSGMSESYEISSHRLELLKKYDAI